MLDGQLVGTTPVVVPDVANGTHRVRVERDGYQAWVTTVDVRHPTRSGWRRHSNGCPDDERGTCVGERHLVPRDRGRGGRADARRGVFNTNMTGYQEVLTDPSYSGQVVTMTCPQIGNYGVAPEDIESGGPQVAGFVIREESPIASNWRANQTLREYLVAHGIVAIAGVDTRALTRLLRTAGVMRGVIATAPSIRPRSLRRRNAPQPWRGATSWRG